jgi:NADP-dependent 3-hydroxy acid dehydrogenase YdfG
VAIPSWQLHGNQKPSPQRSPTRQTVFFALSLDLSNPAQIAATVHAAIKRFSRIDVLVNNAGHGLLGAIEEASDEEILRVFETNVFGLIWVTRAVLPHLRRQRSGHVVNLSSIGGLVGLPGWGIYNATKFAVEGLSEASPKILSARRLSELIVMVLENPNYRDKARWFQKVLGETRGLDVAADIIERAFVQHLELKRSCGRGASR